MKTLFSWIEKIWGIQKEFQLKVLFLSLSFFMLTACQAIWRPLKTTIFVTLVGVKHVPDAKLLLMLPLIILIIIYSKLVDWLRRHHIFYWFVLSHGIGGIILFFFISHPVYGLANTAQSTSRVLGWVSYFFFESFGAFMSAVFWAFANSINKPKDAKRYYSLFVSGSKVGGIIGAGTLYYVMQHIDLGDTILLPRFLLSGSLLMLGAGVSIFLLMKFVPGYLMHGYEAAYQYEKKQSKAATKKSFLESLKNGIDGLLIMVKNSYVFGILTIILSYEIIIVILDYLMAIVATNKHSTAVGIAGFYASYMLIMHSVGLLIALFGTAPIQRLLGIRLSLFACPIIAFIAIAYIALYPTPVALFWTIVLLRALNYGLNHPTREALFIPTTKAIKFKAKAWTDSFGSRTAKAGGSLLNKFVLNGVIRTSAAFGFFMASIWLVMTYFLGKTFQKAVDENRVIGSAEEN